MTGATGKVLALVRSWGKHRGPLSITLGVTFLALLIYIFGFLGERPTPAFEFLQRLELASLDLRFQWRGVAHPDRRIVIVDIDQRSQEVFGQWPFPRIHFAHMLDALREDGARVVAFDVTFSKPGEALKPVLELRSQLEKQKKQGARVDSGLGAELDRLEKEYDYDQQLADAIRGFAASRGKGGGGVVLGNFFLMSQAELRGLDPRVLQHYADEIAYFPFPQVRPDKTAKGPEGLRRLVGQFEALDLLPPGAQANLPIFRDALRGDNAATGFFNVRADPDGVVRRAQLVLPFSPTKDPADADLYASLDVQALRLYLGRSNNETILNYSETGVTNIEFGPTLRVKPDEVGRFQINYQGPAGSYERVSMADVANRNFPPGKFRNRIVLVGASAIGVGDLRATPFGRLDYPGVEIHANVIDDLLNQKFLHRGARQALSDLGLILLLGLPLGLWLALVEPRRMPLALLLGVPLGGVWYFAFTQGAWLNVIVPLGTLLANTGLVALYRVLVEEREKRKIHGAFRQYISPEVIRRVLQNPEFVQPRKTELSIMFSDIRGFTSISEKLDAQELALFLNDYLTDMTRIVFRNKGTLDKYIGDAVMAFWGAPFEEPGHAEKACRAALEMIERVRELQKQWQEQGKPKLDIGLGINSGVASVGNMGSSLRYGYTAMGDAVNLASRLEGLNKEYGTHIIVSDTTFQQAQLPDLLFRELDLIRVKGKTEPVTIYELLGRRDGTNELEELATTFAVARAFYQQRRWCEAQTALEKILKSWPDDGPARAYWKRCQAYAFQEPPPEWDGVHVMTHK